MQKSEASENELNKILQYGMEITLKKINTKLQMLQIDGNECPRIRQRSKIRELEKYLQISEERLEEVEELKLEQEENMKEIKKWTSKHEAKV